MASQDALCLTTSLAVRHMALDHHSEDNGVLQVRVEATDLRGTEQGR